MAVDFETYLRLVRWMRMAEYLASETNHSVGFRRMFGDEATLAAYGKFF